MHSKRFFLLISILFNYSVFAKTEKSGYVFKYFGAQNAANLDFTNLGNSKLLSYDSNTSMSQNIMLAVDGLAISFPTGTGKKSATENFSKGESSATDLQFTFVKSWFGIDLVYQNYSGFYLTDSTFNSNKTDSNGNSVSVYQQYSSMHVERESVNLYYLSNPQGFSYNAAFSQSERQTSSGGSWISMLSFSNFLFNNPSTFIPTSYQASFGKLKKGKAQGFSYMFGGAYTFASGAPFATFMLVAGPIRYSTYFEYEDKTENRNRENGRALIRMALGINGETFILSATLSYDQLSFKTDTNQVNPSADIIEFSLGMRF